jgi:hypothetical protein
VYGLEITRDAKPCASIVVAPDASSCEKFAATELQAFIEAMSGAKLDIANSPPGADAPAILLGRTAPAPETAKLKEDGFAIKTDGNRILIAGSGDRGTLFGVYAFLESIGCRWLVPGDLGQVIPKKPTIDVPPLDVKESPDFDVRAFFVGHTPDAALWALRNRMNGFYSGDFAKEHGGLFCFQPPLTHVHSFYQLMPVEKYFSSHPEYYPLIGGKRVKISSARGQLCTTSPDVTRIVAEQARGYFQKNPWARFFTIGPNDGMGWCECDKCKALDAKLCNSKTWSFRNSKEPVTSDRLAVFSNAVAEQALGDLPGRELCTFAYVNYVEPPVTAVPDKRVVHWVCQYAPACYNHEIADLACPDNADFDKSLRGWAKVEPWMGFYAYTDKSMWVGLPRPVTPQMAAGIKYLYSLGVRKYVAQSNAMSWPQMSALYYVTAKLLWKADRPLQDILDDYYSNFFGPAAPDMRRYDEAVWKVAHDSGAHYSDDPLSEALKVFDVDKLSVASDDLTNALQKDLDDQQRQRVEKIKASFDYGVEFLKMLKDIDEYERTGEPEWLKAASVSAKKYVKRTSGHPAVQRVLEGIIAESEGKTPIVWEGFGKPEVKGGRECRNSDETGPGDHAAGWVSFRAIIRDASKPHIVTMEVWGESQPFTLVVCSKGRGKGTAQGGVWTPIKPEGKLSGRPEWCALKFRVPPNVLEQGTKRQIFGFGGADSQIWVADIRILPEQ